MLPSRNPFGQTLCRHGFLRRLISPLGLAAFFFGLGFFLLSQSGQPGYAQLEGEDWRAKIEASVLREAAAGQTEFLIFLKEQADLSGAEALPTKLEKGWYVYRQLTAVAQRTQAPLLEQFRQRGVPHRAYWVTNMIWVRGDANDLFAVARRREVARIVANPAVSLDLPVEVEGIAPQAEDSIEWNLQKVHADEVWALGYAGQGVVIGGQDTGYTWQHPALKNAYRGWDGSQAEHDYNWHDAIHEEIFTFSMRSPSQGGDQASSLSRGDGMGMMTVDCPYNSPQPCDDHGHGTHTMGTMVGLDGSNQIGMAPQAKWIGCRNMDHGWGTPATYTECFQWFIAPTRLDGSDPNPAMAPDVINNSWSCPPSEGCNDPNILKGVVEAVRAAGILTVQSAGNEGGGGCETIRNPAGIYAASLTVGATDSNDTIATFSSRGPVSVDGSNRLKPDVVAPGVSVRSSFGTSGYAFMSGTSMAAPHVAGLAALLISADPELRGKPHLLEFVIKFSAIPQTTNESCGGVPGSTIPNNTYGYGRIDAFAAYRMLPLHHIYFPWISRGP